MISSLNTGKISGGNGGPSTNPQCIFIGVLDGCNVTACGCNTNGCNPGTNGCNPTATQNFITCLVPCG